MYVELLEYPALLQSRRKIVEIRADLPDCRLKIARGGRRGMSPELAQLARHMMYEAVRRGVLTEDGRDFRCTIPETEVRTILGRDSYIRTDHLNRIAESLCFALWLTIFGKRTSDLPKYQSSGVIVFGYVRRATEHGMIEYCVDSRVVEALRKRQDSEVRVIQQKSISILAGLDAITAGLVQWLAPRWHGNKYKDISLRYSVADLYRDISGVPLKTAEMHWWFRQKLKRAIEIINERDLLALLEIDQPRRVNLTFQGTEAHFMRINETTHQARGTAGGLGGQLALGSDPLSSGKRPT